MPNNIQRTKWLEEREEEFFEDIAEEFTDHTGHIDRESAQLIRTFLGPISFEKWLKIATIENTVDWSE